jgi:hypothetical protein
MLAIVKSSANMRETLLYNTLKVEQKQALFLDAHNFIQEKDELTIIAELETFRRLTQLNERTKKHAIHITLNFAPSDQIEERTFVRLADEFMRGIDFRDQPWLLYQHIDAGHPHLHIVSTNIRPDGTRISNDLRSPYHLKQLCYRLEEKHHLTPAIPMPDLFAVQEKQTQKQKIELPGKAIYGQAPTKKQIQSVLRSVNDNFSYTSFEAYNAILSLYNVRADRGREDSEMYRSRGLYYRLIDAEGRKVGAPIKASDFDAPVTLRKLELKFKLCQEQQKLSLENRIHVGEYMTVYIDYALALAQQNKYSLRLFKHELAKERIAIVIPALRQRPVRKRSLPRTFDDATPTPSEMKMDDGHGIFYVDLRSMNVVRDTDLGPRYTAASILERTGVERELRNLYKAGAFPDLRDAERKLLEPDYPDAEKTRYMLLRLSPQHDKIVEDELKQQQQLKQAQRQKLKRSYRHRHSL